MRVRSLFSYRRPRTQKKRGPRPEGFKTLTFPRTQTTATADDPHRKVI